MRRSTSGTVLLKRTRRVRIGSRKRRQLRRRKAAAAPATNKAKKAAVAAKRAAASAARALRRNRVAKRQEAPAPTASQMLRRRFARSAPPPPPPCRRGVCGRCTRRHVVMARRAVRLSERAEFLRRDFLPLAEQYYRNLTTTTTSCHPVAEAAADHSPVERIASMLRECPSLTLFVGARVAVDMSRVAARLSSASSASSSPPRHAPAARSSSFTKSGASTTSTTALPVPPPRWIEGRVVEHVRRSSSLVGRSSSDGCNSAVGQFASIAVLLLDACGGDSRDVSASLFVVMHAGVAAVASSSCAYPSSSSASVGSSPRAKLRCGGAACGERCALRSAVALPESSSVVVPYESDAVRFAVGAANAEPTWFCVSAAQLFR